MISVRMASENELDLHELTWQEALPEFIAFNNEAIQQAAGGPAPTLNVIHGYGSSGAGGVLRKRLQGFLQEQAAAGRLEFIPGESVDSNPGHTLVLPVLPLPATDELLANEIVAYCRNPRTLNKINGKFRRHGVPAVKAAIDTLVRQRRLRMIGKDSRKTYEATE